MQKNGEVKMWENARPWSETKVFPVRNDHFADRIESRSLFEVICRAFQSHAIQCLRFDETCRQRHMSSSEDSFPSRYFLTQQCKCKDSKHPSKKRSSCGALSMCASARNENIPARNVITSHPPPTPTPTVAPNCWVASNMYMCNKCFHIPSHPTPIPIVARHQPS